MAADETDSGGRILDENGNLFGRINIVDLFVILIVIAVVGAGAALVLSPGDDPADTNGEEPNETDENGEDDDETPTEQTETRYATLDLGTQPQHIASAIADGDTWSPNESHTLEITDSYRYHDNGGTNLLVRVALNTTVIEDEQDNQPFTFDGSPVRLGDELAIETDDYGVTGEVLSRDSSNDTLAVSESAFLLRTEVPVSVAEDIEAGDTDMIGDTPLVTVENVTTYATGQSDTRTVVLGVTAQTIERDGTTRFGDGDVRVGSTLQLQTDEYEIDGEITRRGTLEQAGTERTVEANLSATGVSPAVADSLTPGLTEQAGGLTTVEVTGVETQPAEVILESDDGNIFAREHPRDKDVDLSVELTVRERDDGTLTFRGESIRTGETVALDFGELTVEMTLSDIER